MKKLLALSLTVVSGLAALQGNNDMVAATNGQRNGDCCSPCTPCCVPKPKKCIDCECYVPSYYDLQCDWGMTTYVDFLYWYANESNLSYAMVVTGQPLTTGSTTSVVGPTSTKHLGTNWDPGFRIGLGWNTGFDGWDVDVNWTWFHNNKKSNTTVPSTFAVGADPLVPAVTQTAIVDPWLDASVFNILSSEPEAYLMDTAAASWKLQLNTVDATIGRKYWLSKRFTMRPYAGARGSWAKTMFSNHASRTTAANQMEATDSFKNKFWGVGLLAGFQPEWHWTPRFSLFSNMDASLIWGQFKTAKSANFSRIGATPTSYSNYFHSNFSKMQPMIDLAFGLRWTETYCMDRYRSFFDLAWEHHVWFDTNNRLKTNSPYIGTSSSQSFASYEEEVGNLSYGGLVLRARFDY